jgi:hypothetical protein
VKKFRVQGRGNQKEIHCFQLNFIPPSIIGRSHHTLVETKSIKEPNAGIIGRSEV